MNGDRLKPAGAASRDNLQVLEEAILRRYLRWPCSNYFSLLISEELTVTSGRQLSEDLKIKSSLKYDKVFFFVFFFGLNRTFQLCLLGPGAGNCPRTISSCDLKHFTNTQRTVAVFTRSIITVDQCCRVWGFFHRVWTLSPSGYPPLKRQYPSQASQRPILLKSLALSILSSFFFQCFPPLSVANPPKAKHARSKKKESASTARLHFRVCNPVCF